MLIESGLSATGSVDATLDGHHYNRGVRAHKLVAEGIGLLRWAMFLQWNTEQEPPLDRVSLTRVIDQVRQNPYPERMHVLLTSEIFTMAKQRFTEFC